MERLLITGITGYFGKLLMPYLLTINSPICYLVRGGERRFFNIYKSLRKNEFVIDIDLDKNSSAEIMLALREKNFLPQKVIHMAALVEFAQEKEEIVRETNCGGTKKIIEVAKNHRAEIIFFSTYYVHGIWENNKIFPEDFIYGEPKNPYEASKQNCEIMIKNSGLPYKIIRPSILADCFNTGYCGLLRYFWIIKEFFLENRNKLQADSGLYFKDKFLYLPLKSDFYLQESRLNFITGSWVRKVLPDIISSPKRNIIVHLINEEPPINKNCFKDAFETSGIKPMQAINGQTYPHNTLISTTILRIFEGYLRAHPAPSCTNLKSILDGKYEPHPKGEELKNELRTILQDAVKENFGFSENQINRIERVLNI